MRQTGWIVLLLAGSTLAACKPRPDPVAQAREDARAVAMVEAAQKVHPPPVSLAPQPWSAADIARHRLTGSTCRFGIAGEGQPRPAPVLVAGSKRALIRVDGRLMVFAADPGSPELVPGMTGHYVGKSHSLTLERRPGDGTALGAEALTWPATLTIRDAWGQIVYTAPGQLGCQP